MTRTQQTSTTAIEVAGGKTAIKSMAERYEMSQENLVTTLQNSVLKGASHAEFSAFLVVANQYQLNPFTKEIHAFTSGGGRGIVPMVGIDGWAKIVNRQEDYDGSEFELHHDDKGHLEAITCRIYVKDRRHPVAVTEYLEECKRDTLPWKQMPRRMLRHKAFMQAARLAFGIAGLFDEDEASDVARRLASAEPVHRPTQSLNDAINNAATGEEELEGEVIESQDTSDSRSAEQETTATQEKKPEATEPAKTEAPKQQTANVDDDMSFGQWAERMETLAIDKGVPEPADLIGAVILNYPVKERSPKGLKARRETLQAFTDGRLDVQSGKVKEPTGASA